MLRRKPRLRAERDIGAALIIDPLDGINHRPAPDGHFALAGFQIPFDVLPRMRDALLDIDRHFRRPERIRDLRLAHRNRFHRTRLHRQVSPLFRRANPHGQQSARSPAPAQGVGVAEAVVSTSLNTASG